MQNLGESSRNVRIGMDKWGGGAGNTVTSPRLDTARLTVTKFKLHLETLDARIVPDATPTTSIPIPPPAQGGINPQIIWQQLVDAAQQRIDLAKLVYLDALMKIEADIKKCETQMAACDVLETLIDKAEQDLTDAAAADKPAKQEILDLWKAQAEIAYSKLDDLVYAYRDDRIAARVLLAQLLALSPNANVTRLNGLSVTLDPAIDDLVPLRLFPDA